METIFKKPSTKTFILSGCIVLAVSACGPKLNLASDSMSSLNNSLGLPGKETGEFTAPSSKAGTAAEVTSSSTGQLVIAKEYHHTLYDRYFVTTRLEDQNVIEGGPLKSDWTSTGKTYAFYQDQVAGSSPIHRFYVRQTKTHFYTTSEADYQLLKNNSNAFVEEGIEGYAFDVAAAAACPAGSSALLRAYSNATDIVSRRHRFTKDATIISNLVQSGWLDEGVSFCIPAAPVVVSPVLTTGPIRCGSGTATSFFTNVAAVKANYCDGMNVCASMNGTNICEDKFGPCVPCTDPSYVPPVITPANSNCSFDGNIVNHQAAITAFQAATVPFGSTCISEQRTCNNGVLSGSLSSKSCVVRPEITAPANCAFGSTTLGHGQSASGYSAASVQSPSTCNSQAVTCNDGVLSQPSFSYNSCTVSAAPAPIVLPAGTLCLDSPLHTIKASDTYKQISSTSTSLQDPKQYASTRLRGHNMIWPVKIVVDSADTSIEKATAALGVAVGYGSGTAFRRVVVSKTKCDMTEANNIVISGGSRPSAGGIAEFSLNEATRSAAQNLSTGVYYLNIQNEDCGVNQGCDVLVDWHGAN